MNYIIRRKEKKDCYEIANVVTIAWQETYRGIINDEFLDNLPNTEEEKKHTIILMKMIIMYLY
jgi:hypothetical protein